MSSECSRAMVALLLAPVLTGLAIGLLLGLLQGVEGVLATSVGLVVLSAMFGWPLALVFGLPMHLLLWRRRSVTILHYAVGGAVIALTGWAIVAGWDAGECQLYGGVDGYCWEIWHTIYPGLLLPMVVPSTIAAVVFWLIMAGGRLRRGIGEGLEGEGCR